MVNFFCEGATFKDLTEFINGEFGMNENDYDIYCNDMHIMIINGSNKICELLPDQKKSLEFTIQSKKSI